jgi:hypothetical protein
VDQDRDEWSAVLNTVMNIRGSQDAVDTFQSEELLAPEQGLCSMELVS